MQRFYEKTSISTIFQVFLPLMVYEPLYNSCLIYHYMKYNNRYRVKSTRLNNRDYGSPGSYFVTINIKQHICLFGEIENGIMNFTPAGEWANKFWQEIPDHFPHVSLGEHVIMPNHIHGILVIGNRKVSECSTDECKDVACHFSSPQLNTKNMSAISPKPGSLPVILRSYKSAVSRIVHTFLPDFNWQERYHDRIIRFSDFREYQRISNYIVNNPINWGADKFFFK